MSCQLKLVYILCGNAAYNRGDRGNLLTQIRLLREAFPEAQIVVDSYRPEVDSRWYDATVIKRGVFLTWQQWGYLKKADVVVWGGGALVADNSCRTIIPYWLVVITLIKKVLHKPVMAWAQGLVIQTKMGAILGRAVLNQVDIITVRDEDSFRTLERIGAVKPPHYVTADPAMLVKPSSRAVGENMLRKAGVKIGEGKKLIAISPTFWSFYHDKRDIVPYMFARKLGLRRRRQKLEIERFKDSLVKLIDMIIEIRGANVILMPRYPSRIWDDMFHIEDVCRRSKYRDSVYLYDNDDAPPQDYLAMWWVFDLVISVALHDTLFALAIDRPCVQLFYEPKGKDLAMQLGADKYMGDWSILLQTDGAAQVMGLMDYAFNNETDARMKQARDKLKKRVGLNVAYLKELLSANGYSY